MASDDLVLDLRDYKDTTGAYVDPGSYVVVVDDAEQGKSSQKGTPELTVWLRILGGAEDGQTLVEHLYLTKGSMFRVVRFLSSLGIKTPREEFRVPMRLMLRKKVIVRVEDDTYNNQVRSRVQEYRKFTAEAAAGINGGVAGGGGDSLDGLDEFSRTVSDDVTDLPEPEEDAVSVPAGAADEPEEGGSIEDVVADQGDPDDPGPDPEPAAKAAPKAAPAAAVEDDEDEDIDLDDVDI